MEKEIKKYLEINKKIKNTKENLKKIDVEIKSIYHSAKTIDIFKGEKKQELDNLNKKERQLLKCEEIQTI